MPVEVRYDEFTDDITANRLVKAAAHLLGMMRLRSVDSRKGLVHLGAALGNVALFQFSPRDVPKVEFDRLNGHYREVVALSRLILEHNAFQVERGTVRAPRIASGHGQALPRLRHRRFARSAWRSPGSIRGSPHQYPGSPSTRRAEARCVFARTSSGGMDLAVSSWATRNTSASMTHACPTPISTSCSPTLPHWTCLAAFLYTPRARRKLAEYAVRHSGKLLKVFALDLSGSLEGVLERVHSVAEQVRAMRAVALAAG